MNYKKMTLEELEHEMCKQLKKENKELRKRVEEICEQSKWIKFNPNDPSTHPPKGQHFIAYGSGYMSVMFRYSSETETDEKFANRFSVRYGFTHWRPQPPPPVETEDA